MTQPQEGSNHAAREGFDPQRLRTLADMRRSRDGKMIGGVCTGAARHLDIDPVVPRVVLVTLTLFGLSGVIVYGAVWLLIPEEGEPRSIAGKTFNLGENEEQFRIVGLIIAAIIAIASASSLIGGDAFGTPFPYLGLVALFFLWLFVIRPYQRDRNRPHSDDAPAAAPTSTSTLPMDEANPAPGATLPPYGAGGPAPYPAPRPPNPRHDRGLLTALTVFVAMIALGALWTFSMVSDTVRVPVFVSLAVTLAILGLGMLVGTFIGNGRPLIPLGVITALALAVSLVLPVWSIGQRTPTPTAAAGVQSEYSLGVGEMRLDLSEIEDLEALDGRTIAVEQGVGSLTVVVPRGLDADIDAATRGGQIQIFDQTRTGNRITMQYADTVDNGPDIDLVLDQNFGNIEVVRP